MSSMIGNGPSKRIYGSSIASQDGLLQYCLRTLVFEHNSKLKPKYQSRQVITTDMKPAKLSNLSYKHASISSIAEILSGGTVNGRERRTPKFPKELIKLLETALKRVVMRQDPAYDDALLRGTFGVFYGYYTTDAFQKSVKDNRKIEDLILMFFSKATGELQKRATDGEVKYIVNQHVAKFVRLILQVMRTNRLVGSESELIVRLSEYEAKLLQNSEILAVVPPSVESVPCPIEPLKLSQMPLTQKLQAIFHIDDLVMQSMIDDLQNRCTDDAVLRDLKQQLDLVNTQSGSSNKIGDFDQESSYFSWKQTEINDLTRAIVKLTGANPGLASANNADRNNWIKKETALRSRSNSTSSEISEVSKRISSFSISASSVAQETPATDRALLFYTPMDPHAYYHDLLEACLDYDMKMNELAQMEDVQDNATYSLLNIQSKGILSYCRSRWRVSEMTHKVNFIDVCKSRFLDSRLNLDQLDEAFAEIKEEGPLNFQMATKHDKGVYKKALVSLNESLFRDLYAEMQQVFISKIDTRILTLLEDHIYSDILFQDAAIETAHLFDELEQGVEDAANQAYSGLYEDILQAVEMEVLHVVRFGASLFSEVQKFKKRYKRPILDIINVWHVYLRVTLPRYLADLPALMEQSYRTVQGQGADFAISDMFDLYRTVYQIHDLLKQFYPQYTSPINMDKYFRPVVLKWLLSADRAILELVPRIVEADRFNAFDETVAQDSVGNRRSQSVVLLFRSLNQHLTHLRDLQWPDEYWAAKLVTSLCRTFSEAIKDYCTRLEKLFGEETAMQVSQTVPSESASAVSFQQRLIARARDAMTKKEPIEPFHISESACLKLNNIEWSKVHLDMLEQSIDSAHLSSILEKYEGHKPAWVPGQNTLFTIKVVSAENLVPCDANGYSDPYVVLSDQKGKRVGKTRTIYTNLNPRWDESFDIPTTEPLWLAATVWDRDAGGEHDICGRCYFKLDPRYFSDFQPKDFHINLDTQGALTLKITMEGEMDDSTFYFARAFRFLDRAESDMTRSIVDKMTPFISTSLSRAVLQSLFNKPITIDNTIDSAYSLLNKAGFASTRVNQLLRHAQLTKADIEAPIEPLMQYLDNNFRVLDASLSRSALSKVMSKLWNYILLTLEDIIVPSLSTTKTKIRPPLKEHELDVVYNWLGFLKDTFAGDGGGLSEEELQTPQYHELLSVRFFYFDEVEELMRECDRMAATSLLKQEEVSKSGTLLRKAYNLGTIKKARDERKLIRQQLSSSEEIILRVSHPILVEISANYAGPPFASS